MTNYLDILGGCFPSAEAYVPASGSQTNYDDLIWVTTPILQATLDVSPCASGPLPSIPEEILEATTASLAAGVMGKLFEITFNHEGDASNDWLETDDVPTNQTPIIIPFDCRLVALTFSNREETSKTELEIRCVAEGGGPGPSVLKYTWILDNIRTARKSNFISPITFLQGDMVAVFAKERGDDQEPCDVRLVAHFIITASNETESLDDWTGDIEP